MSEQKQLFCDCETAYKCAAHTFATLIDYYFFANFPHYVLLSLAITGNYTLKSFSRRDWKTFSSHAEQNSKPEDLIVVKMH